MSRVDSIHGCKNVKDYLDVIEDSSLLIDSIGFGSYIDSAIGLLKLRNSNNNLILIPSFEYFILTSDLFKQNVKFKKRKRNREEYITELLNNIILDILGKEYDKGAIPKCLLSVCNDCTTKCKYYIKGDKFKLICGDLYEKFINSFGDKYNSYDSTISNLENLMTNLKHKT